MKAALISLASKAVVLTGVGVLAFFLGASWKERQAIEAAAKAGREAIATYKAQTQQEIAASAERNKQAIRELEQSAKQQDQIKQAALDRLQRQLTAAKEKKHVREHNDFHQPSVDVAVACPGDGFRLDVGTVRLLDAARAGLPAPDPASGADEALDAPSAVGLVEFVSNDLDIVKLYHELAKRHDGLVDYIESKQKQNQ